jgi:hypothetical protein
LLLWQRIGGVEWIAIRTTTVATAAATTEAAVAAAAAAAAIQRFDYVHRKQFTISNVAATSNSRKPVYAAAVLQVASKNFAPQYTADQRRRSDREGFI